MASIRGACSVGDAELVKTLLSQANGENIVNSKDTQGATPLHIAATIGALEVVRVLLHAGATVTACNNKGHTPLHLASEHGHVLVVQMLLEHGAQVDPGDIDWITPLHLACRSGHVPVVQLLLEKGANVDTKSQRDLRPLQFAAHNGRVHVVELLLERGAEVNAENKAGRTALNYAASKGHTEVVKLLLDRGATVFSKASPPLIAATESGNLEMMKLLMQHGAKMDHPQEFSRAFIINAEKDRMDVCEMILQNCLQVQDVGHAIAFAADSREPESYRVMELLIEAGANVSYVHSTWKEQYCALHKAVLNRDVDKVWLLMLNGANTLIPYCHEDAEQTVWQLCEDSNTYNALLHFWTPQTHKFHPKCVKDAIL